jgi:hypothetical protein
MTRKARPLFIRPVLERAVIDPDMSVVLTLHEADGKEIST